MKKRRSKRTNSVRKSVRNRTKCTKSAPATAYEMYDRSLERRTSYGQGAAKSYAARVHIAHQSGHFRAGEVAIVNILHVGSCTYTRTHCCTCTPEITVKTPRGVLQVDAEGGVTHERTQ